MGNFTFVTEGSFHCLHNKTSLISRPETYVIADTKLIYGLKTTLPEKMSILKFLVAIQITLKKGWWEVL
jgi:hypothetical protein